MTPYSEVFDSFKDLVLRDTTFFKKVSDDVNVDIEVKNIRMLKLLKHAITNMLCVNDKRDFEINFMLILDDVNMQFTEDLTLVEIDILAYYMWQCYIEEEVVTRINALRSIGFSDDEIKTFSPANSLKEFNTSIASLKSENEHKVKEYKRRGRSDFKIKTHKFVFDEA